MSDFERHKKKTIQNVFMTRYLWIQLSEILSVPVGDYSSRTRRQYVFSRVTRCIIFFLFLHSNVTARTLRIMRGHAIFFAVSEMISPYNNSLRLRYIIKIFGAQTKTGRRFRVFFPPPTNTSPIPPRFGIRGRNPTSRTRTYTCTYIMYVFFRRSRGIFSPAPETGRNVYVPGPSSEAETFFSRHNSRPFCCFLNFTVVLFSVHARTSRTRPREYSHNSVIKVRRRLHFDGPI